MSSMQTKEYFITKDSSSRKAVLIFITKILTTLISFIGFYFVANYMGPEVLGIVGFAGGFIGTCSLLVDPGLNITHIKRISEGKDLGKCNGTYFMMKGVLIIVTVILIFVGIQIYKYFFINQFDNSIYEVVLYITLIGAVVGYITNALKTTYSSLLLTAKQEIPEYMGLISVPIKIGTALSGMGAVAFAIANTIGMIVTFGTSIHFFRDIPITWPTREYRRDYITFAKPIALVEISRTLSMHVDKIILLFFCGALQVGYLYAAQRIANLLGFISISIRQVFFPLISKSFINKNDINSTSYFLDKAILHLIVFLLPIVIIIAIFSKYIIYTIAGEYFFPAADVLVILCIWVLISGINILFQNTVVAAGYNSFYGKVGITTAIVAIVGNIILVPESIYSMKLPGLGASGAALSILISAFTGTLMLGIFLKIKLGYNLNKKIKLVFLSGVIFASVLFWLKNSLEGQSIFEYFAIIVLGTSVYLLVAYLIGAITKEDFALYHKLINLSSMKNYITSELWNSDRSKSK